MKWTLESCKEDALRFQSRQEWQKNSRSGFYKAWKMGWLDECCAHMIPKRRWRSSKQLWKRSECLEDAKRFQKPYIWKNLSKRAYARAERMGWLAECCAHMDRPKLPIWTLEACKADALRFGSRSAWAIRSASAYNKAREVGWLAECCAHMVRARKGSDKIEVVPVRKRKRRRRRTSRKAKKIRRVPLVQDPEVEKAVWGFLADLLMK